MLPAFGEMFGLEIVCRSALEPRGTVECGAWKSGRMTKLTSNSAKATHCKGAWIRLGQSDRGGARGGCQQGRWRCRSRGRDGCLRRAHVAAQEAVRGRAHRAGGAGRDVMGLQLDIGNPLSRRPPAAGAMPEQSHRVDETPAVGDVPSAAVSAEVATRIPPEHEWWATVGVPASSMQTPLARRWSRACGQRLRVRERTYPRRAGPTRRRHRPGPDPGRFGRSTPRSGRSSNVPFTVSAYPSARAASACRTRGRRYCRVAPLAAAPRTRTARCWGQMVVDDLARI